MSAILKELTAVMNGHLIWATESMEQEMGWDLDWER